MSLANLQHFLSDHYLTSSEKIHQLYHEILYQMTDDNGMEMMLAASVVLSEYCEFLGSQSHFVSCARNSYVGQRKPIEFFVCGSTDDETQVMTQTIQ